MSAEITSVEASRGIAARCIPACMHAYAVCPHGRPGAPPIERGATGPAVAPTSIPSTYTRLTMRHMLPRLGQPNEGTCSYHARSRVGASRARVVSGAPARPTRAVQFHAGATGRRTACGGGFGVAACQWCLCVEETDTKAVRRRGEVGQLVCWGGPSSLVLLGGGARPPIRLATCALGSIDGWISLLPGRRTISAKCPSSWMGWLEEEIRTKRSSARARTRASGRAGPAA